MTDKLILKEAANINGRIVTNSLKLKQLEDGAIQIYVTNGEHRGYFRLYANTAKELKEWLLQRNIK